jgi:biotin transport system substrate-specific component
MTVRVADQTLLTTLVAAPHARLARAAAVGLMTALTILAAQVSLPLPFTPVPLTLQPMVVLLGGAALGSRLGAASQVLYLALGVAGFPVFAASPLLPQGMLRLLGPTGGYLMAYPLAAFVTGLLAERGFDRRYWSSLAAMAAGLALVFGGGVTWLAVGAPGLGLTAALDAGLWPFVGADLIKLAIAAGILPTFWRIIPARS